MVFCRTIWRVRKSQSVFLPGLLFVSRQQVVRVAVYLTTSLGMTEYAKDEDDQIVPSFYNYLALLGEGQHHEELGIKTVYYNSISIRTVNIL